MKSLLLCALLGQPALAGGQSAAITGGSVDIAADNSGTISITGPAAELLMSKLQGGGHGLPPIGDIWHYSRAAGNITCSAEVRLNSPGPGQQQALSTVCAIQVSDVTKGK